MLTVTEDGKAEKVSGLDKGKSLGKKTQRYRV